MASKRKRIRRIILNAQIVWKSNWLVSFDKRETEEHLTVDALSYRILERRIEMRSA